ncbi:unnamed protein product [Clonostachys rosea]|uniref:GED domain-containing protein n=1 Tax=Bionectria ochroleuca TaxID=29856 RepID=A0ABY6U0D4_BIOOC|nr:unnamed protein product [Clonostachys rosea]
MSTQGLPIDKAISTDLFIYNTGKPDRKVKLVIRIRPEKDIKKNQWRGDEDNDNTGAGRSFSLREIEVYGVPIEHLVVVVGELLPRNVALDHKAQVWMLNNLSRAIENAVPTKHPADVRIVVCLLNDPSKQLYVLADKKEGLCALRYLRSEYDRETFYYGEWTKTSDDCPPYAKRRKTAWKKGVNEFCSAYIQEHNADIPLHFNQSTMKRQFVPKLNRFECVVSDLKKSLACYKHSENPEYLNHMISQLDKAIGCQPGDRSKENDMKLIVNLISGDEELNAEEANKAAVAYKLQHIWSGATPRDLPRAVTGGALYQLGTGLRTKIIEGYPSLQENRYQQFISIFCTLFEKSQENSSSYSDSQRDIDILAAYRSARRSAVDDIDLRMVPVKTGSPESVVLVEMQQHIKELRFFIEVMSERIECISSAYPSRPTITSERGLPEHIRRLMNTIDVNEASEHVSHIIHYFTMQEKAGLSSLIDMIAEVEASSIERMETFAADYRAKVSLAEDENEG